MYLYELPIMCEFMYSNIVFVTQKYIAILICILAIYFFSRMQIGTMIG